MAADRSTRLGELKKLPSPFRHSAAGPSWAPRSSDVLDLNSVTVTALRGLIEAARAPAAPPAGALVLGAAGSGKSHLIGTLHERLGVAEGLCTVVEVRPPVEPARPLRHMCAQLVATLAHRPPGDPKPAGLTRILARAVASWLADDEGKSARLAVARKELDISRQWENISGQVSEWLQDRHPELWPPLLEVLIQYPVPLRQARTVQWMRGDALADRELAELGVSIEPARSEADLENMAAWKMSSLMRLLALDRPLVVAFDGLESHAWRERRPALNRMLEMLFQGGHHVVVLASARTDGWSRIADTLEGGLRDRFGKRFEMGGCSRAQVDALFARRLASLPRGTASDGTDLFPFDDPLSRHQLMDLAAGGRPLAREVLRKGRQMWVREVTGEGAGEAPTAFVAAWLAERQAVIESELERYPPEEGVLLRALSWAFDDQGKEAIAMSEAMFRPTGKGMESILNARLRTRAATFRFRFIASTKRDPIALSEPIWAALRQVTEGQLDIPIVVRDYRSPVPDYKQWPGGRSPLEVLLDAGGYLLQLDRSQLARCWALAELEAAVQAQALEVITPDGDAHPVTMEQVKEFYAEKPLLPAIQSSVAACTARVRDRRAK